MDVRMQVRHIDVYFVYVGYAGRTLFLYMKVNTEYNMIEVYMIYACINI